MLQCVPFPTCWLLRGDGKHLFIILCIISHSIILITSFPQDSSEMGLSYHVGKYPMLGTSYSYLSTLPVFPRLPPSHLPLCSAYFSQTHYDRRRMTIRKQLHDLQCLRLFSWTFGVYVETLMFCFLNVVKIKRLVFQTKKKFFLTSLKRINRCPWHTENAEIRLFQHNEKQIANTWVDSWVPETKVILFSIGEWSIKNSTEKCWKRNRMRPK